MAGNCSVTDHGINLSDPRLIKQIPRRIPIQMRAEAKNIVQDMKTQGIIKESQSP